MSASTRWLIGIGAGVALLIIASIVIALTRGGQAPLLAEATPEGVVQRFLLAVQDKDYAKARDYLSPRVQAGCSITFMRDSMRWREDNSRELRVEVLSKDATGDGRTQVRVAVTEVHVSPPFGVDESRHEEVYILREEDGAWRIDEPPWPVGYCPEFTPYPARTPTKLPAM